MKKVAAIKLIEKENQLNKNLKIKQTKVQLAIVNNCT